VNTFVIGQYIAFGTTLSRYIWDCGIIGKHHQRFKTKLCCFQIFLILRKNTPLKKNREKMRSYVWSPRVSILLSLAVHNIYIYIFDFDSYGKSLNYKFENRTLRQCHVSLTFCDGTFFFYLFSTLGHMWFMGFVELSMNSWLWCISILFLLEIMGALTMISGTETVNHLCLWSHSSRWICTKNNSWNIWPWCECMFKYIWIEFLTHS
jgi:hypothetical protein